MNLQPRSIDLEPGQAVRVSGLGKRVRATGSSAFWVGHTLCCADYPHSFDAPHGVRIAASNGRSSITLWSVRT